jgi:hypothetical protein
MGVRLKAIVNMIKMPVGGRESHHAVMLIRPAAEPYYARRRCANLALLGVGERRFWSLGLTWLSAVRLLERSVSVYETELVGVTAPGSHEPSPGANHLQIKERWTDTDYCVFP